MDDLKKQEVYKLLNKAIEDYNRENYEMAIVYLDDALQLDPHNPDVYYWRGKIATTDLNDEVIENAIADFSEAINLKPDYWEAYFERGKVYLYFNRLDDAEKDFLKVVELNPKFKDIYSYLAQIEIQRGNDEKAMEYLNKMKGGGDYKYYFNLGMIFFNAKSYQNAIKNFSKALELNKYLVDAYYYRAKSYEAIGEYKKALTDFKNATILMPEEKKFFTEMARVFFKMAEDELEKSGDILKAADLFIEGLTIDYNLKINPKYENVFRKAAKICIDNKDYKRALEYLEFEDRVLENTFVEGKFDFESYQRRKEEINALMKEAEKRLPLKERIKRKLYDIYLR
ncbi:MAG: hypothetical protein DSY66_04210 [Persephonella sp.]|nr:MAG: hypothetical protein DSY66_04210 [Persephonella sp.]